MRKTSTAKSSGLHTQRRSDRKQAGHSRNAVSAKLNAWATSAVISRPTANPKIVAVRTRKSASAASLRPAGDRVVSKAEQGCDESPPRRRPGELTKRELYAICQCGQEYGLTLAAAGSRAGRIDRLRTGAQAGRVCQPSRYGRKGLLGTSYMVLPFANLAVWRLGLCDFSLCGSERLWPARLWLVQFWPTSPCRGRPARRPGCSS